MTKTNQRISWTDYFMSFAVIASKRSTCPKLDVGAAIIKDHQLLSTGYNGSVSGDEHCYEVGCLEKEGHCIRAVHAEMNALMNCARMGKSTVDAEIFVTHFPCTRCMPLIIQAGVRKIFYLYDYHNDDWSIQLAEKSGVELEKCEVPDVFN